MDKSTNELHSPELRAQGSMTPSAKELMERLTKFGARCVRAMTADEVVYGFMGATINLALALLPPKELSDWMRRLADGIDAECTTRKEHAN